jgi:hypothetical protein
MQRIEFPGIPAKGLSILCKTLKNEPNVNNFNLVLLIHLNIYFTLTLIPRISDDGDGFISRDGTHLMFKSYFHLSMELQET